MHTLRSTRASYVAAFLLGALIALLLQWPAHGAEVPAAAAAVHSNCMAWH